jgi:4-amino-4-deoxy-L-arabinose transferase-like glycosyltransferase
VASAFLSWTPPARIAAAINRWFDAAPSGRAVWVFLALFVVIWTGFQIVSYASIDLHPDLLEVFAWSQNLAPGYKHPPLAGFVAAAWFAIFPIADWSFHLLAMVNVAVAFFAIDLIARRYLDGDKRLLVLLLLLLTPLYQFHGQRFSTNQILLSTWPLATYCFLRSFESPRSLAWSAAAGATAALAMLGKYYSILLVIAFIIAALAHPRRLDYLRSPAPWVTALIGLLVLAPHLHWFLTTGGKTLYYANRVHGGASTAALLWNVVTSTVSAAGYVLVLLAAYALIVRPDRRTLRATLWPDDPSRRMLVLLFVLPLLLPIVVMPLAGIKYSALWTLPAWFLLPIILLSPPQAVVGRLDAVRVAFVVLCVGLVALMASPAVAWMRFAAEQAKPRAHFAAASQEVTRAWRRAVKEPLAIVASTTDFANAASFYSPDHPKSWDLAEPQLTPWFPEERPPRNGWAAVCPVTEELCVRLVDRAAKQASGVTRVEFDHAATFLGRRGPSMRFVFVIVPPGD